MPYTARSLEVYNELNQEMWLAFERGEVVYEIRALDELPGTIGLP